MGLFERKFRVGRIILGFFVLSVFLLLADNVSAERGASFAFNNGYRADDLDWNIAGDSTGNNPNILSELSWNDLKIYQAKADGRVILDWFYLRGSIGYGWILDGENQDSDYGADNRTLEWSRSNNSADNGNVMDASVGMGYPFEPGPGWLRMTPLLGYSFHEQNLTMTNGEQTLSDSSISIPLFGISPSPVGPISGLNSTYESNWKGPWAGIDLSIEASRSLNLFGSFEYHWANYEAEANWNLRTDFAHPKSFEHIANGKGIVVSGGGTYAIDKHWLISANVDYQKWSTDAGTDRTFFSSGATSITRLNEVNWSSFAALLGIVYRL